MSEPAPMIDLDAEIAKLSRQGEERLNRQSWAAINPHDDYPGDGGEAAPVIRATPFNLPDPASIPPREWLFGRWFQRKEAAAMIATTGVGKTTLLVGTALSLSSGRDFLDRGLPEGAVRVWLWNLEDDREELDRQFAAGALYHGLTSEDLADRLFVDGLDKQLCTATETSEGAKVCEPVFAAVTHELRSRRIDLLIVDPFVSSHAINENDNRAIDAVAKRWSLVAKESNCAILLVHHTRKTGGNAVTVEDARGGSSLSAAVRTVLTLNTMTEEEGNRYGITDRAERLTIVRVDNGKSNRAPPENAYWFKKHSVDLGNGAGFRQADNVGAAAKWTPPDPFDGLSVRDLYNVQQAIAEGEWAQNVQAANWAGHAVAEALALDASNKQDKARIGALLRDWIKSGALLIEHRHDSKKGRERPFVVVGNHVDPASLPTPKGEVGKGGELREIRPANPSPPHPLIRGGGGGGVRDCPAEPSVEICPRCEGEGCEWCA